MIILLWLISLIVSIMVLQWIIISAINSSELTKEIRELKDILMKQNPPEIEINQSITEAISHITNSNNLEKIEKEECPACGNQVLSFDKICGSCGLTLMDDIKE